MMVHANLAKCILSRMDKKDGSEAKDNMKAKINQNLKDTKFQDKDIQLTNVKMIGNLILYHFKD